MRYVVILQSECPQFTDNSVGINYCDSSNVRVLFSPRASADSLQTFYPKNLVLWVPRIFFGSRSVNLICVSEREKHFRRGSSGSTFPNYLTQFAHWRKFRQSLAQGLSVRFSFEASRYRWNPTPLVQPSACVSYQSKMTTSPSLIFLNYLCEFQTQESGCKLR